MLKKSLLLSLTLIVIFQTLSHATDYSKGIVELHKVVTSAKNVTPTKYPNSDSVVLDNNIICNINDKGLGSQWEDQFFKILTQQGVENNKIQTFQYPLPYIKVEILKAELIKTDGQVVPIDIKKQSNVIINPNQLNDNIIDPNNKQVNLNIPNLQIGDIIRVVLVTKYLKKMINNMWSTDYSLQNTYPIIHKNITISIPKSLPLKSIAIQNGVKNTIQFSQKIIKDLIVYKWVLKNVPRFFPENNMPQFKGIPLLLVSTISDWQYISKWYWSINKPHIYAVNKALKNKVKELTKNKKTDLDKIKALYYYVSDNIRYLQTNIKKNEPFDYVLNASYIFDSKTGICRNKALLLVSMLRLAGFKSYPTIISVGEQLNKKVPMPFQFDHAIVAVELKPDNFTLLDPTMGNRSKQIFPSWLSNSTYLIATPSGQTLKIVPSLPAIDNAFFINTSCNIKNGKLYGKTIIKPKGFNSMQCRFNFSSLSPKVNKLLFQRWLQNILPNTKLEELSFHPNNLLDMRQNLQIILQFSNSEPFVQKNNIAVMNLPWWGELLNNIFDYEDFGLQTRQFPLKFNSTSGYVENISVNYKNTDFDNTSIPKPVKIDTNNITYTQKCIDKNNVINVSRTFLNKKMELSPKEYLDVKNNLKTIETAQIEPIILEKPKTDTISKFSKLSPFSQRFIYFHVSIDIKDDNIWTKRRYVKKKILSHTQLIQNSELKIPYNPIWESVKITNACTITADGKKSPVEKKDIHIMDQAWTASASRYPEGKILVVNFPGVEVGSIIEYELEIQNKNKPFLSEIIFLKFLDPIDDFKLSVSSPDNMDLKISSSNLIGVQKTISKKDGNNVYKWTSKNISGNIPVVYPPPLWVFNPTIFISDGDWKQYYKELKKKFLSSVSDKKDIKVLTDKLINEYKTDTDKLIGIRNFISKNIRNAGPKFIDLPTTSLSSADITLKDGYGNSADSAILLYSMLKIAGFKPEFILVSPYPNIDLITSPLLTTPQRSLFISVLVRVKTEAGYVYLNDTNQYSKLGATPSQFKLATLLKEKSIFKIEPLKNMETAYINNYNIKINNDSSADFQIIFDVFGSTYSQFNKLYSQIKPIRRKQHYQKLIAQISQDAEPLSKLITNFKKYPGTRECTLKINNFSSVNNNFDYFKTLVKIEYLFNIGSDTRYYPYYIPFAINREYNIKVKLLKEYDKVLIIPKNETYYMPNNSGIISIKSKLEMNKKGESIYTEKIKINIKPSIYTPQQYQKIVKIYNAITSPSVNTLLLGKTGK